MSESTVYPACATVRTRCRALGLPTWRTDTAGTIVEEPSETGLAGLWLRSGRISEIVGAAARAWARQPSQAAVVEAFDGCWLLPIPDEQRRRRIGTTIALALSPAALNSDIFAEACRAAGLDQHTARTTLRRHAGFDRPGADTAAQMLQWMGRDLNSLAEHEGAVHGFTSELSQSYDTIDLLYTLGRSMMDLEHPEKFVAQACTRLHETMHFGWLGAKFIPDPTRAGAMASRLIIRGTPGCTLDELDRGALTLAQSLAPEAPAHILPREQMPWAGLGTQVLAQPILREGRIAGVLLCGDKHGHDPQVNSYDMRLVEATAAYTGSFLDNACLVHNQQAMLMGSLKAMTAAIDAKDRYTCGHSERVAMLGRQLAIAAGLDAAQAERVHMCGLLHDVGKIGVPEAVLGKAGRLTDQEFALIEQGPALDGRQRELGRRDSEEVAALTTLDVRGHHQPERAERTAAPGLGPRAEHPGVEHPPILPDGDDREQADPGVQLDPRAGGARLLDQDEVSECPGRGGLVSVGVVLVGRRFQPLDQTQLTGGMLARSAVGCDLDAGRKGRGEAAEFRVPATAEAVAE